MEILSLLRKLCEVDGVPGYEEAVDDVVWEELEGFVDELYVDKMGNLVAVKGEGDFSLMVSAHKDEVGLIVTHVEEKGFLRFAKLDGIPDHVLPSKRVRIYTRSGSVVSGVIGLKSAHLMTEDERKQVLSIDKLFIDVGASSREEVYALGIREGDPVAVDAPFLELPNGFVCAKALDDRAGCAALIQALKSSEPRMRVYGVFTVQEEVGLRGAVTSAYSLMPDAGIALENMPTSDHPEAKPEESSSVELGKGPALVVADGRRGSLSRGYIIHPKMRTWVEEIASKRGISLQKAILEGGTTDATAIQTTRGGVPSCVIAAPARYMHSFSEVLKLSDLEQMTELLRALLESKPPFK